MKRLVVLITLSWSPAFAGPEEEAIQHASLAAYKQFGIESAVNALIKQNVPADIKALFEKINPVITAIAIKRVEIIWKF